MNNIFSYYTKYREHIGEYNRWNTNEQAKINRISASSNPCANEKLKQKAKAITEPILLLDKYTHERAEDSETFFQTLNMELISIAGVISTLPTVITKIIPFLDKNSSKHSIIEKTSALLKNYKHKQIKFKNKTIPLSKALTIGSSALATIFYMHSMKNSMESQLGIIRKASFDASQNIINNPNIFTVLTKEQEKELNRIIQDEEVKNTSFVDKLKDRFNINSSFRAVDEYKRTHSEYSEQKRKYFEVQEKSVNNHQIKLNSTQVLNAQEDKLLFDSLLKNVEHNALIPLERVEKIANISYSAIFTGGFLEYLISDKLVDILGIKNKPVRAIAKLGIPILTYMVLNKNIADFENKAILATKYKYLKKFENDPLNCNKQQNKKQNLFQFMKTVFKDMKDYNKFTEEELPNIEKRLEAKKQIKFTNEQLQEAKLLQKNTAMTLNAHKEHLYNQTVGIEALSETILGPLDVLATAVGATIGSGLSKKLPNKKLSGLYTAIGAILAFIPAAIVEAVLTKEQKSAEKNAAMLAMKDLNNPRKFADLSNLNNSYESINLIDLKNPKVFENI